MKFDSFPLILLVLLFVLASMLTIIPWPQAGIWLRPQWLLLLILACVLVQPEWMSLWIVWFIGIWMDLLTGVCLGQHALIYVIMAYLIIKFRARLLWYLAWQQTLMIGLFSWLGLAVQFCLQLLRGDLPPPGSFWLLPFFNMLVWPLFFAVIRDGWKGRTA